MKTTSTALALILIPVFFLLLGIEYWIAKRKRLQFGSFENLVSNIITGLAERTFNLFVYAFFIQSFYFIYDNYRFFTIQSNWLIYILILPLTDLVWYWYHRLGHEINILWAAHVVHHQSNDFNFSVAARITIIQACIRNIFWCLIPLLGFHPQLVSVTLIIHGAYSFFTHTKTIKSFGLLEHILITPSHHRVHHASNELYINKNYGDLFVFWDKLFGTYQKEVKEIQPVYGLTEPIGNYSFLWQHFHYFFELGYHFNRAIGLKNKVKILFGNPDSLPHGARAILENRFFSHRKKFPITKHLKQYLIYQVIGSVLLMCILILQFQYPLNPSQIILSTILLLTFINCGALLEQKRWIIWVECARAFCILLLLDQNFSIMLLIALLYTIFVIIFIRYKFHIKYWKWMFK